ncbi:MAG TPA: hemerythrin domain-containing protein [Polyangiaceae bacterium]|nr:hemerythrin domain-containing protein [Polyangiaceae bacterium]
MKATSLLAKQHKKVKSLFKKLESGKGDRQDLNELANDLGAHMAIEQQIFYPAVRKVDSDLVGESFEEHALAEIALKRLLAVSMDAEAWKARLVVLKELILHHVEEEEGELFPRVERALGDQALNDLGRRMKPMFDECVERGFESLVPRGNGTTSADVVARRGAPLRARGNGATAHR